MNPQHAKEIRNRSGARWSAEEVVEEVEDTMSPEGMTAGDTIAAISTAAGTGAIGIVRMSGPEALEISGKVFVSTRGRNPAHTESHRLLYGHAVDPANGRVIDEVLLAVMRGPATYTREDLLEFHCHGGAVAQRILFRLLIRMGARPAMAVKFKQVLTRIGGRTAHDRQKNLVNNPAIGRIHGMAVEEPVAFGVCGITPPGGDKDLP